MEKDKTKSLSDKDSGSAQTHGSVNLGDLRSSVSHTRTTFTRRRLPHGQSQVLREVGTQADFITLISIISILYREFDTDLTPIQQFNANTELYEDGGHTCVVSQRAILTNAASNVARGTTDALAEDIVVKRPRESVLASKSSGLKSFITELRIRTHPPIWQHPNIVVFKGVAWDFEDEQALLPRPLLLEEFAPQRSLDRFWRDYNFVRMTFQSKVGFCIDIVAALNALHGSHIVHGDIKPENILIFPKIGHHGSFIAKLTDFGHSVSAQEGLTSLPAFSTFWCAPEVQESVELSFEDMTATDVYSYGLVILSIMIGRSYYHDMPNFEIHRETDTMLDKAMELIEQEDRQNYDSDLELDTIRLLFRATLKRNSKRRSLKRCMHILEKYQSTQFAFSCRNQQIFPPVQLYELGAMDVDQMVSIGYQTLSLCSHQLKNRISTELQQIAMRDDDPRGPAAAWELSVCFFSGFGVKKSFSDSSKWLLFAASRGVEAAEAFCSRLHRAMHISTEEALAGSIPGIQQGSPAESRIRQLLQDTTDDASAGDIDSSARHAVAEAQLTDVGQTYQPHDNSDELINHEAGLEYDNDSILSRETIHRPKLVLPRDLVQAVVSRSSDLSQLLLEHHAFLNGQDRQGDTLLHIAAKAGNYHAMDQLLDQPNVDASICNSTQESALHLLTRFTEPQIKALVPRLIAKKADPQHEALPRQRGGSLLHFSLRIRSCPILRSVLGQNLALLRCLLEEIHNGRNGFECRICESGSRLRRIVTFALSTFNTKGLQILLDHVKLHKEEDTVDLGQIEVWSNRRLIPLWKIPFDNVIIKTLDLPESCFRAMYFAEEYMHALHDTLSFVLAKLVKGEKRRYELLLQTIEANNVDAVDFVLTYAKLHDSRHDWWMPAKRADLRTSPVILAINHGLRDVLERLHSEDPRIFHESLLLCERKLENTVIEMFFGSDKAPDAIDPVNFAQICLSVAVAAPHQDQFFFNFILDHASRKCIVEKPARFSNVVGHQPTYFLAQAILTSSFDAASTVFQRFPEVSCHHLRLSGKSRGPYGRTIPVAKLFRSEQLEPGWNMLPRSIYSFVIEFTEGYDTVRPLSLSQYVLLVGSYKHCAFIVKQMHATSPAQAEGKESSSLSLRLEEGTPDWYHHRLDAEEFRCILLGNIIQDRKDRQPLWGFIRAQVAHGHHKAMNYLRLALKYGNNRAVVKLVEIGWELNGPSWKYLYSPLRLSVWLEKVALRELKFVGSDEWKLGSWGDLETHKKVHQMYLKEQTRLYENFEEIAKQNSETLREHGAIIPRWVEKLQMYENWRWLLAAYLFIYFAFLPLLIGGAAGPYWKWDANRGVKILWMYIWSLMAMANLPIVVFPSIQTIELNEVVVGHALAFLQVFMQHFVPLLLVTCLEQPRTPNNTGRQWAWPFIILLCEIALVLSGGFFLLVAAGIGILLIILGAIFDSIVVLTLYICGIEVRQGPSEVLANWLDMGLDWVMMKMPRWLVGS